MKAFLCALAAVLFGLAGRAAAAQDSLDCRGADTMQAVAARLAEGFVRQVPGARISVARGETLSVEAFVDLLAGRANCALFARELFPAEEAAYKARFGRSPVVVPIALGSFATLHATHAIAVYVNAVNPLTHLPLALLAKLFAAPLPDVPPAITRWGQLGAAGEWAGRPIHLYGMRPFRDSGDPPGIVNFLRQRLLGGNDMRSDVQAVEDEKGMPALAGIVAKVGADPDGIGYSGFGFAGAGVKTLALCRTSCVSGTPQSVASGKYTLRRYIYLVFPRASDGAAPALARGFAGFVLSPAGQRIVAASKEHFLALPPRERRRARQELARRQPMTAPRLGLAALPAYLPQTVQPPPGAGYLRKDGKIVIAGYNDMRPLLAALDLLFAADHPGTAFALDLEGTRMAPAALASGRSAFAPMGADFEPAALEDYLRQTGAAPLRIRVAHDAIDPTARSSPLAVYVHRTNPLQALSREELARIFSGRVQTWAGLGVQGPLASQPLHRYGLAPGTPLARIFAARVTDGAALAPLNAAGHSRQVVALMTDDPLAIGFADLNQRNAALKPLALSACTGCKASRGSAEDLVAGRYLLDRHLLIYLRTPLDPFVREYMRLVLSREGQAAIAASAPHYLPLNAAEAAAERAKLE